MEQFKKAHDLYHFPVEPNRRGKDVKAISDGISFGGGQQVRENSRSCGQRCETLI